MKSNLTVVLLIACLLFASVSYAWNEPDNIAGIKFWRELSDSIKPCKGKDPAMDQISVKIPCFTKERGGIQMIYYIDLGVTRLPATAYIVSKQLSRLDMSLGELLYPRVVPVFIERYGTPTRTMTETWMSVSGTSLPDKIIIWDGKRLSITIRQRGERFDIGSIIYETDLWRDYSAKKYREQIKDAAKKF